MMEYAVLIATVSAALVAMQIYMKRGMQGRLKDLANQISPIQYERGNTTSDYTVTRTSSMTENVDRGTYTRTIGDETTTRTGWETVVGND